MMTLADLQRDFMGALCGRAAERARGALHDRLDHPDERLAIYVNNTRAHFLGSLRATFPVVCRLVGEEYFAHCVALYQARHPSLSGDLEGAGECLTDFLRQMHASDRFSYLGDVAELEWAYAQCLTAADASPLDILRLSQVPAERQAHLRFSLHPASRLVASPFPLLRIWECNQTDASELPAVSLDEGEDRLLLLRHARRVQFERLSVADFRFLSQLSQGVTLERVIAASGSTANEFDASHALCRWVVKGVIVEFHQREA